jgi:hypothetical protein
MTDIDDLADVVWICRRPDCLFDDISIEDRLKALLEGAADPAEGTPPIATLI